VIPEPRVALPARDVTKCKGASSDSAANNVDPGFGPDRPSPFASAALWAMMGGIAAVFVVTLIIVAFTN